MKKNKIIATLLLVIIVIGSFALLFKSNPIKVKADSGFDSSYDSGGSYDSGSSSWGSSSSDWGSSSSSSSSGSGSGLSFGTTMLIIIIVIIYLIVQAKKGGISITTTFTLDHSKEVSDEEVSKLIPNFKKEEFLQNRYLDYLEDRKSVV